MEQFIKRVKKEMESQGVGPTELANRAGCGRAYIYRVLSREQTPSLTWALKIAKALKIKVRFEKIS